MLKPYLCEPLLQPSTGFYEARVDMQRGLEQAVPADYPFCDRPTNDVCLSAPIGNGTEEQDEMCPLALLTVWFGTYSAKLLKAARDTKLDKMDKSSLAMYSISLDWKNWLPSRVNRLIALNHLLLVVQLIKGSSS
ncbi:hypothetical protein NDU88_010768 [Pleurodeles waltl]|uniref:Uncharacterized protein n=1 Tax=Pleurodeles waltl TaxID=8319 RepID=A0AAV7R1H6_PLEWA|nr:hypothetical protein NDU88_010768 [Pleurodeles waltl]